MSELHPISAGGGTPQADVIFVHGLDGHPFKTSQHDPNRQTDCWLHWLSEDASAVAVHTLEYAARSSAWLGQAMSLVDRAKEVLNELTRRGIGNRPIIFVCHSLGGLLAKQLLRTASDDAAPPAWRKIADQTKGNAWAAFGETRRAIELYEQRLAIAREIGDRMGEGNALFNSGLALDALGERDEAVRRVREAFAIHDAIGASYLVEQAPAQLAAWGAADDHP
jgi:tetratricopeptide (TPR) repeat protein